MYAEHVALSMSAALERIAQTVGQADGLPLPVFKVTQTVHGEPLVIIDSLDDSYAWANHLRLPLLENNTLNGEKTWRGRVNGVLWSCMCLRDEPIPYIPVNWDGPAHQTQLVPVVDRAAVTG